MLTLIVGANCPRCNIVKSKLKKEIENGSIKVLDMESGEAVAEILLVFGKVNGLSLPILINGNNGWENSVISVVDFLDVVNKQIYGYD
jgi:hypothetical protein